MVIDVLYSGSDGNACRVYTENTSILIDCGVSKSKLFSSGQFPVDAIFVSHEHGDHISGVHTVARYTNADVYLEDIVYTHMKNRNPNYLIGNTVHFIETNQKIAMGDFNITIHATSHDSIGGLWFTIENKKTGLIYGHLTDTGLITDSMVEVLQSCDGILLESNHDIQTLKDFDDYPIFLKNRIKGNEGHLSNSQAIEFLCKNIDSTKLRWVVFAHLSKRTNKISKVKTEIKKQNFTGTNFSFVPSTLHLK